MNIYGFTYEDCGDGAAPRHARYIINDRIYTA